MNPLRFKHIKNLLAEEGATTQGVARRAKASWDTVRKVSQVGSYAEYKGVPVEEKTPDTVSLKPVSLVEQLKAERDNIVKQFNDVIATVERLKL